VKNKLYLSPKLHVANSPTHGYGVFTSGDLKKSDAIEEAYYLTPEKEKWEDLDPKFMRYFFGIPFLQGHHKDFADKHGGVNTVHISRPVCVLGFGMIYNHNQKPNITHSVNEALQIIRFTANQNIAAGSELTISYNPYTQF
jgi:SET domain-containing protein